MNPLAVLLIAASTTAADPLPVAQGPVTPVPAYSYSEPGSAATTEGSRPRLFSRIRKLFRRESQPADQFPATSYPASASGSAGSNVWGTMPPAASVSPQATPTGPTAPAILRPVPATPAPEAGPVRRMPTGSPF